MWRLDHAHPCRALLIDNLVTQGVHSCPVDLRPEMMFGVITITKPDPVIELVITAHAPRNRLVRIATAMAVVAVQIREAVAKVIERQKETDVMPVEDAEDHKSRDERREFEDSPKRLARILPFRHRVCKSKSNRRSHRARRGGRRFPCDAACECIRRRSG